MALSSRLIQTCLNISSLLVRKYDIILCSFYSPLTNGSNFSMRWTIRTCSLSGGSGKSAFATLSLFKFFTTAPLTLSQNW